jgi:tRNA 2-thiouridine synthesizing protein A
VNSPVVPPASGTQPPAPPPTLDLVPAQTLDARGLRCPLPLLRAKQALRTLAPGEVLMVMATDAGSVADFAAYARLSGEALVAFDAPGEEFHYWFRKH